MGGIGVYQAQESVQPKYPAKGHLASAIRYLPDKLKSNWILLTGGKDLQIGRSDQTYPFIQESFFYYCSGLTHQDCFLLYDIKHAHLTLLIPAPRTGPEAVYLGQRPSIKQVTAITDCDKVLYADESLPELLESIGGVFYTLQDTDLLTALTRARSIKNLYEIDLLRQAATVSGKAHENVAKLIRKASTEQTLDTVFRTTCAAQRPFGAGAQGGLKFSYTPIVASGRHASTLHYTCAPGIDTPLEGDLILVDAAASVQYYASDITRTYPRNGTFTTRARELYGLVLEMQEASIATLGPGATMAEAGDKSHEILTRAMVKYGWVTCDLEIARRERLSEFLLMHGIGHHVGLDVHDVAPDVRLHGGTELQVTKNRAGYESPLETGNVVTIEPGVYFNMEYLEATYQTKVGKYFDQKEIKAWSSLGGVRIEDVLLVTKDGSESLTHVAKSIKDVEALCQSN